MYIQFQVCIFAAIYNFDSFQVTDNAEIWRLYAELCTDDPEKVVCFRFLFFYHFTVMITVNDNHTSSV